MTIDTEDETIGIRESIKLRDRHEKMGATIYTRQGRGCTIDLCSHYIVKDETWKLAPDSLLAADRLRNYKTEERNCA